jgi:YHS domain-containing protein
MKKSAILLFIVFLTSTLAFSQSNEADRKKEFNLSKGTLAIEGYDPVSYFTENKAVKGKKEFAKSYKGIIYYFSSEKNSKAFVADPAKYEPQYGGWCAYAMGSTGEKVEVDPETFKIRGGKLYLFYNAYFNNTLKSWNKDEVKLQKSADINWTKFTK